MNQTASPDTQVIHIRPRPQWLGLDVKELWVYRELLYFLTWRDIKVRYKQTFMGAAWVIIQPLATMLLFVVFFNKFAGVGSGDIPYPLFAYTGLLLWTFFSNAVLNATNSLINSSNLITKVYFPRMFIPAAAIVAGLVDLAIASVILIALGFYYNVTLSWQLLLLPVFILITLILALAVGLITSSLTVRYRDLKHALPFLIQLGLFASPIIYPSSIVPESWRWVLLVNPIAPIIDAFRAALFGTTIDWTHVLGGGAITFALLMAGLYIFTRMEESFADVI